MINRPLKINAGPNAVRSVALANNGGTRSYQYDNNGNLITDQLDGSTLRTIDYNAFNKPTLITVNGGRKLSPTDSANTGSSTTEFFYGANQMRYKQVKNANGEQETTLYIGKAYEEVRSINKTEKKVFLDDIAQITETITASGSEHRIGFFHKDRLGSTTAIVDDNGNVMEARSFDAFGKPRKEDLSDKGVAAIGSELYKRGFTDHEHLDDSQLIHMNGRAYDYNLGRFLSVDPFIQEPGNSQSMNPYSYIMNNPLAGTDPSGYLRVCDTFIVCSPEQHLDKNYNKPIRLYGSSDNGKKSEQGTKSNSEESGSPEDIGTQENLDVFDVEFNYDEETGELLVSFTGGTEEVVSLINNEQTLANETHTSVAGGIIGLGRELDDTGKHRLDYEKKAKSLSKDDVEGRKQLKSENRKGLTGLGKAFTEQIDSQRKKTNHVNNMRNATKTNPKVNLQARIMSYVGKGFKVVGYGYATYQIATDTIDVNFKTMAKIGAGIAGAYQGSKQGAKIGARGGPWGALAGAIIGGGIGAYVAESGAEYLLE